MRNMSSVTCSMLGPLRGRIYVLHLLRQTGKAVSDKMPLMLRQRHTWQPDKGLGCQA
jgi:hypothetical protein